MFYISECKTFSDSKASICIKFSNTSRRLLKFLCNLKYKYVYRYCSHNKLAGMPHTECNTLNPNKKSDFPLDKKISRIFDRTKHIMSISALGD